MTDKKSMKEFVIASSMYSLGSILGPLLTFGGVGFILDKVFETKPWLLLISIFFAFITTQVLLFKKIVKINKLMETHKLNDKENKNSELVGDKSLKS